jgi:DNA-binding response OmpR family regulator
MAKNILVIDDDETITTIIDLALKSGGYTADTANSARDGMAKACLSTPDLILLDYNMPVKDGFTLLKDMRSIPELEYVPVVIITALSIPEIVSQAVTLGVAGFLVKPFDLETLLNRVKKALDGEKIIEV